MVIPAIMIPPVFIWDSASAQAAESIPAARCTYNPVKRPAQAHGIHCQIPSPSPVISIAASKLSTIPARC